MFIGWLVGSLEDDSSVLYQSHMLDHQFSDKRELLGTDPNNVYQAIQHPPLRTTLSST